MGVGISKASKISSTFFRWNKLIIRALPNFSLGTLYCLKFLHSRHTLMKKINVLKFFDDFFLARTAPLNLVSIGAEGCLRKFLVLPKQKKMP